MAASLEGGGFTAVATHDETLIEHAIAFVRERGIPNERFQFQMLYGVRPRLQLDLVRRGFDVLVATPYGPEWYRYLMRRLAERPANLLFFARSLFQRSRTPASATSARSRASRYHDHGAAWSVASRQ